MNAQCRCFGDEIVTDIDPLDTIDPRITDKANRRSRIRRWDFFPYGWWVEADGSFVIFDRRYHPMARKSSDGAVEILPMLDLNRAPRIKFKSQHYLYRGGLDHPCDNTDTHRRLLDVVHRLGLADEILRRYEALYRDRAERRRNFRRYLGTR